MFGYRNSRQKYHAQASDIWNSTPTPLYDEFMSRRQATTPGPYNKKLPDDNKLFWTYVQRLKDTYPKCSVDVTPMVSASGHGKVAQSFNSSGGMNYYSRFRDAEKACQINQTLKPYHIVKKQLPHNVRPKEVKVPFEITSIANIKQFLETQDLEKQKANENAKKEKEQRNKNNTRRKQIEERKRFAAVKQGNLLGLQTSSPNLMSFSPTPQMLNTRATELAQINFTPNVTYKNFVNADIEIEDETVDHLTKQQRYNLFTKLKGMNKSQHNSFIDDFIVEALKKRGGKRKTRRNRKGNKTRKHRKN